MNVEDTIRRLRQKAEHNATPQGEAETCRRMAAKLEAKLGLPKTEAAREKKSKTASMDASWAMDRISAARSHAVGKAFQEFGRSFEPQRWAQAYDRSVEAQRASNVRFDPYLAFEHTRTQYEMEIETDIRNEAEEKDSAERLINMSDLELGGEMSRLTHVLLELQTKLSDSAEGGSKSFLFGRLSLSNRERMHATLERQFQVHMGRFRQLEGELERRTTPETTGEPRRFRFFANPSPA